jgi:hypothetical protein
MHVATDPGRRYVSLMPHHQAMRQRDTHHPQSQPLPGCGRAPRVSVRCVPASARRPFGTRRAGNERRAPPGRVRACVTTLPSNRVAVRAAVRCRRRAGAARQRAHERARGGAPRPQSRLGVIPPRRPAMIPQRAGSELDSVEHGQHVPVIRCRHRPIATPAITAAGDPARVPKGRASPARRRESRRNERPSATTASPRRGRASPRTSAASQCVIDDLREAGGADRGPRSTPVVVLVIFAVLTGSTCRRSR